jgi:yeast amino acid transporter
MNNLKIEGLPHLTNALLVTSIFSAGNSYAYCGTRSLYGLALDGQVPKFLRKCTKSGVPIFCLMCTMAFPCLAFLKLSSNTAKVLDWFVNLTTAAQIIDCVIICIIYIFFFRACRAQGLDRKSLPYYGAFQPYSGWKGLIFMITVVCTYGYSVLLPGKWDIKTFFIYYTMVLVAPILYFGWKIAHRTSIVKPEEADLLWIAPEITAYEDALDEEATGFCEEILYLLKIRSKKDAGSMSA